MTTKINTLHCSVPVQFVCIVKYSTYLSSAVSLRSSLQALKGQKWIKRAVSGYF